MANIFDKYGIKEVADVTIYKIAEGGNEVPVLFLDTLKVSTIEQTAEQVDARGGKGNPKLITWDYNKEITLTLEDALYSPASMALMFGKEDSEGGLAAWDTASTVTKMLRANFAVGDTQIKDGNNKLWDIKGYINESGSYIATVPTTTGEYQFEVEAAVTGKKLEILADDFPGTYKIVGDTYARREDNGEDEYFQFVINKAKISAEQTITLEAEGDPSTFNLNVTVLKPSGGKAMMELVQYTVNDSN